MSTKACAVLIDTVSIQPYIFGSNQLRDNIGASYLIEHELFRKLIPEVIQSTFEITLDAAPVNWGKGSERVEIGYIGGGNALLLFNNEADVKPFISAYSLAALSQFPGVRLAFGVIADFNKGEGFGVSMEALAQNLMQSRNQGFLPCVPFKHGISDDCPRSNESAEFSYKPGDLPMKWISGSTLNKINAATLANSKLREIYGSELGAAFAFPEALDSLRKESERGYLSIVHFDGNGMGARFKDCQSLTELRELSIAVSESATRAMKSLVHDLAEWIDPQKGQFKNDPTFKLVKESDEKSESFGKYYLPIRPLIVGGDDVTFICEGTLGIILAEKFIEKFTQEEIKGEGLFGCAGVAIVKTKYPFYKAYQLAEELTADAKKPSRAEKGSWISYMISSSGFSGELESIRTAQYETPNGKLYGGPYKIGGSFNQLKNGILHFTQGENAWPRSKMMTLRDILRMNEPERKRFLKEAEARNLKVPGGLELWNERKTLIHDMIELTEFYPAIPMHHEN